MFVDVHASDEDCAQTGFLAPSAAFRSKPVIERLQQAVAVDGHVVVNVLRGADTVTAASDALEDLSALLASIFARSVQRFHSEDNIVLLI